MTKFSNAAKNCGLPISITKTEVMYQPAPGKPYMEPTITIDSIQLPTTKQFKYLGSVLSNDAQMDEDINARISKASGLRSPTRTRKGLETQWYKTEHKDQGIQGNSLTTLLYATETWTCYRTHVKMLDSFHMRYLRYLMGV